MKNKEIWEEFHNNKNMDRLQSKELIYFIYKHYWSDDNYLLNVLDLGCGQGYTMQYLCDQHFYTIGIDYSETALNKASNNLEKYSKWDLIQGNFTKKIGLYDNSIDLIVCMTSLASCTDDEVIATLRECRRVLKPEGKIFFQELSDETDRESSYLTRKGHIKMFGGQELADMFIETGFKKFQIVKSNYDDVKINYLIVESM